MLLMDTGVTNIPNDMYPTAASGWRQVSRQGTACACVCVCVCVYIYIYTCVCVYVCLCVCTYI